MAPLREVQISNCTLLAGRSSLYTWFTSLFRRWLRSSGRRHLEIRLESAQDLSLNSSIADVTVQLIHSEITLANELIRTAETSLVLSRYEEAKKAHEAARQAYRKAMGYVAELSGTPEAGTLDRTLMDLQQLRLIIDRFGQRAYGPRHKP